MDFRNDIQGIRALAILLVVFCHFSVPGFSGGYIGVDVFFVISGYLISGLIKTEYESTGKFSFGNFYARRFLRLLPALAFMLLGVSLLACIFVSPHEQIFHSLAAAPSAIWLSNFFYASQNFNYFDPVNRGELFLHTWSLAVEEQFYLVWPIILLLSLSSLKKAKKINIDIPPLIFWVFIISFLVSVFGTYIQPVWAYYMMPARLWQFAVGGILFLIKDKYSSQVYLEKHKQVFNYMGVLGVLLLATSLIVLAQPKYYPGYLALLPTVGAAMLLWRNGFYDTATHKLFSFPLFRYVGDISYSLYLWHWPVWMFVSAWMPIQYANKFFIAIILSILLSIFSYYVIELPFRRSKSFKAQPKLVMILSVCLCAVLFKLADYWTNKAAKWDEVVQLHVESDYLMSEGCDKWYSSSTVAPCFFGDYNATHTAVVIGDSQASQWFYAFQKAYVKQDWNLVVLIKSACPMVDEKKFYSRLGREYFECYMWRAKALDYIVQLKPNVVILGSGTDDYTKTQWEEGTVRLVQKINGSAGKIFIIAPTPKLPVDGLDCLLREKWTNQFFTMVGSCDFKNKGNELISSALNRAANRFSNVQMIDMQDVICPSQICSAERNGIIVYRDHQHLNADYVKSISGELEERLNATVR